MACIANTSRGWKPERLLVSFLHIFRKTANLKVQMKTICSVFLHDFIYKKVDNLLSVDLFLKASIQFILGLFDSLKRSNTSLYPTRVVTCSAVVFIIC